MYFEICCSGYNIQQYLTCYKYLPALPCWYKRSKEKPAPEVIIYNILLPSASMFQFMKQISTSVQTMTNIPFSFLVMATCQQLEIYTFYSGYSLLVVSPTYATLGIDPVHN